MGISKNSVRLSLSKPTRCLSCYIKRLRQAQSDSAIGVFRDALIQKTRGGKSLRVFSFEPAGVVIALGVASL
jgi:hypothetical protein